MKVLRVPPMYKCIGLVDADLLNNGTRHPNLVLLKIAGFLYDNHILFKLITDSKEDISRYTRIYLSRVFTFTELPEFYLKSLGNSEESKFEVGGTGFYATEPNIKKFNEERIKDMHRLENDEYLNTLVNKRSGNKIFGIDMARQMPYYRLYDLYINEMISKGKKKSHYKDYLNYSIGFLTRGCFRHCPFCVNKLEKTVLPYSRLEWFLDNERDDRGRLVRPHIYLWDDNFLAADRSVWYPMLQQLIASKRSFQFRQGLDERLLADSRHGEEIAELLSKVKYHGDFIFAFDNWKDREVIEKALKIWKRYNPRKGTKFYLFCGFKQQKENKEKFYRDILELFERIKILMQYGCVGYVMRHEDYHKAPLENFYVQVARWCNQQQFYKKMSFWEFVYRNQSFWEENTLKVVNRPHLKDFGDFMTDKENGYYENIRICRPLQTVLDVLEMFPEHRTKLLKMFNYKMENLKNPLLWE